MIFTPINLRRVSELIDGSVTTAKLANDAVTTVKLGDGAVTGAKADGSIKTSYLVANDDVISYTGTVYSSEKELRFVKQVSDIPSGEIMVYAEAMASVGTTNVGLFFDSELTPRVTLATVGTGFELLSGTAYIGDLSNGRHTVSMSLRNLDAGVAYNKLIEMHSRV